jgi:hypothetical protein
VIGGGDFNGFGSLPAWGIARWNGSTLRVLGAGMNRDVLAMKTHGGAEPFHYFATEATFGPYPLPAGLAFDAVCIDSLDLNTTMACLSPPLRYTVY